MQLTPSFILLLGNLFVMALDAYAIPLTRQQTGVVTLPLKRTPVRRDMHPRMLLQMHGVRSQRRLARMTGREVPPVEMLLNRRTVGEVHINGRSSTRVGLAGANMNVPSVITSGEANTLVAVADPSSGGFSPLDEQAEENDTLTSGNTPQTANSLGLAIQSDDVGYVATIQMGTPPRNFNVLMDSGSADLWVGAEGCVSDDGSNCGDHVFLGPQSSSSFVHTRKQFNVTYGTGSVEGDVIKDNIVVAGLRLHGHTFGVAKRETADFSSNQTLFDGIMGVAQSSLSEQKTLTPVESLAKAGLIQQAITSFKLSRLADQKNDGEVTFGGLDTSKFNQNTLVTFNNINSHGFWEGPIDAVSANNADLGLNGRTAILDTGTTLMVVPQADADAIHQGIPGATDNGDGSFNLPCTTNTSVALSFGGQPFPIDSRDIVFAPLDPNNLTGTCVSGIMGGQVGGPNQWLLGDVFLKNAYFSTNVGKNTIQLAKLI